MKGHFDAHSDAATGDGTIFLISCKQPAFLSSFSHLQVIQNKRPWCSAAAYVTAGLRTVGCNCKSKFQFFCDSFTVSISDSLL